jgi:hypothetical protein
VEGFPQLIAYVPGAIGTGSPGAHDAKHPLVCDVVQQKRPTPSSREVAPGTAALVSAAPQMPAVSEMMTVSIADL